VTEQGKEKKKNGLTAWVKTVSVDATFDGDFVNVDFVDVH